LPINYRASGRILSKSLKAYLCPAAAGSDLGHHPLELGAGNGAGRRATEIVVNDFDPKS
jgi:hypothetical protein